MEAHLVLVEPQVASVVASPRDAPPFVLVAQAVLLQKAVEVARNVADRSVVVEDVAVPRLVDQLAAAVPAVAAVVVQLADEVAEAEAVDVDVAALEAVVLAVEPEADLPARGLLVLDLLVDAVEADVAALEAELALVARPLQAEAAVPNLVDAKLLL